MSEEGEYASEEQRKALEKLKKERKIKIDVNVDSEQMKRLLEQNIKWEKGKEEFDKFRETVLRKARRVLSEEEIENLGDNTTFEGLKSVVSGARKREEWLGEEHADPVGKGGAGRIPLSMARAPTTGEGYDSIEQMIDDLTEGEHSQNPEEATYAKQVKDELFRKFAFAVKEGEMSRPIVYSSKEKSIIRKMLDKQNERMRRKILKSKGEKDED